MRDKVLVSIVFILLCASFCIGIRDDWTYYILVIPFGWLLLGFAMDTLINGEKSTRKSMVNSTFCALILTSVIVILFRKFDTVFIIGRLICCIGCAISIIRTTYECEECACNKKNDEINRLKYRNKMLNEQIDSLLKH